MHPALELVRKVHLVDPRLLLVDHELQSFELSKLRAVLVEVLFRLLPLVEDLLLDTQFFMVHPLCVKQEVLEFRYFIESLDLMHVTERDEGALKEGDGAGRTLLLLLETADLYEFLLAQP